MKKTECWCHGCFSLGAPDCTIGKCNNGRPLRYQLVFDTVGIRHGADQAERTGTMTDDGLMCQANEDSELSATS